MDAPVDIIPPVIILKGKNPDTVEVCDTIPYMDMGAAAIDTKGEDISTSIIRYGKTDRSKVGNYTLIYVVKDIAGNADTALRTVVVKEGMKPDLLTKYNVPAAAAFSSLDKTYKSAEITGDVTNAPNLSTMTEFRINWDRTKNTLYLLSINMHNPIYYVDLKSSAIQTLDKAGPTIHFTGVTKIANFDGEYFVTVDADNFVMAKTNGSFAIIFKP